MQDKTITKFILGGLGGLSAIFTMVFALFGVDIAHTMKSVDPYWFGLPIYWNVVIMLIPITFVLLLILSLIIIKKENELKRKRHIGLPILFGVIIWLIIISVAIHVNNNLVYEQPTPVRLSFTPEFHFMNENYLIQIEYMTRDGFTLYKINGTLNLPSEFELECLKIRFQGTILPSDNNLQIKPTNEHDPSKPCKRDYPDEIVLIPTGIVDNNLQKYRNEDMGYLKYNKIGSYPVWIFIDNQIKGEKILDLIEIDPNKINFSKP